VFTPDDAGAPDAGAPAIDAGSTPTFAWASELADGVCDWYVRCQRLELAAKPACVAWMSRYPAFRGAGVARGAMSFDADAGARCLAGIRAWECGGEGPGFLVSAWSDLVELIVPSCGEVFAGRVAADAGCHASAECGDVTHGCGGPACQRTCQPAGELGAPCGAGWCLGGWCNPYDNRCAPFPAAGAPCIDGQCAPDAFCATGNLCVRRQLAGEACATNPCVPAAYCGPGKICAARRPDGMPCTASNECLSEYCDYGVSPAVCWPLRPGLGQRCSSGCTEGLRCLNATCVPGEPDGAPCELDGECASATCDAVLRRCRSRHATAPLGGACTVVLGRPLGLECSRGTCLGAAVAADGGVGVAGTCRLPQPGDGCHFDLRLGCPDHHYCARDGGLVGTCQPGVAGSRCTGDHNCTADTYCTSGGCAPRSAAGQPCEADRPFSACERPYSCLVPVDGGAARCRFPGEAGDPCSSAQADMYQCKQALECIAGRCTPVARPGTRCAAAGWCLTGLCNAGTCGPWAGAGAPCPDAWTCASLVCEGGRCIDVCR